MNKYLFSTALLGCIFMLSLFSHAQQGLKSGSLQIVISNNNAVLMEVTGPLSFKETISENIILSNLTPGEYRVKVYTSQKGTGHFIINQTALVNQGRRTIMSVLKNRVSTRTVLDENSQYIYTNNRPDFGPGNPHQHLGARPMSDDEFNRFYQSVRNASFDKDKLKVVSVVTDQATFTTEQIRKVIGLFSFDNGKLDCAKMLSEKAYDRQNLYLLAEEFSFSKAKNDFLDFIKNSSQSSPHR